VRQAHVTVTGEGEQRRLLACAVPDQPGVRAPGLLAGLREQLPGHAVPAEITLLPELPLTPNGKVDQAALLRAVAQAAAARGSRPAAGGGLSGRTEHVVAGTWREVLGLPAVGPSDNFFDLGGHSLTLAAAAAKLAGRIGRPVAVLDLFRHPTIRELAAHLDGQETNPVLQRAAYRAAQRRRQARPSPVPGAGGGTHT
jgi:hypothetical protein